MGGMLRWAIEEAVRREDLKIISINNEEQQIWKKSSRN